MGMNLDHKIRLNHLTAPWHISFACQWHVKIMISLIKGNGLFQKVKIHPYVYGGAKLCLQGKKKAKSIESRGNFDHK